MTNHSGADEATKDRSKPEVDYSNDPDNVTPVTAEAVKQTLAALTKKVKDFGEVTENVAKAVERFDEHVDKQLDKVRLTTLDASLHTAAAVDRVNNVVMGIERRVDEKLSGFQWKLYVVLTTCVLLVLSDLFGIWWKSKGRDIQYKILETCSECSQSR